MAPWYGAPIAREVERDGSATWALDPRTAYVLHASSAVFVWVGARAHAKYFEAARAWSKLLHEFEHAAAATTVSQGEESGAFWDAFGGRIDVGLKLPQHDDDYGVGKGPIRQPQQPELSLPSGAPLHVPLRQPSGASQIAQTPRVAEPIATPRGHRGPPEEAAEVEARVSDARGGGDEVAELYAHPEWEALGMFDSDDLDDDGAYVLLVRAAGAPSRAYVWIGDDAEGVGSAEDLGRAFLSEKGLPPSIPLHAVSQGDEPQAFWDLFING